MKRTCGCCHWEFTGIKVHKMVWCKAHRYYVCWRCWEDKCCKEHKNASKQRGGNPFGALVVGSWPILAIVAFLLVFSSNVYLRGQWSRLDQEPVIGLQDGDMVRVKGVVNHSSESPAFGRPSLGYWDWDTGEWFRLSDSTGSVNVSLERYYIVEDGPSTTTLSDGDEVGVYNGGDQIIVIGRVEKLENGTAIQARWIGSEADQLDPGSGIYQGIGILLFLLFLLVGGIARFWWKREKAHKESLGPVNPIPVSESDRMMDPSLHWIDNPQSRKAAPTTLFFLVLIFFTGTLPLLLLAVIGDGHSFDDHIFLAMVMGAAGGPLMVIMPFAIISYYYGARPAEIALARDGVHLHYPNSTDRYLEDSFHAWGDLLVSWKRELRNGKRSERCYTIMVKNRPSLSNFEARFSDENLQRVARAWKKWKKEHPREEAHNEAGAEEGEEN